MNGEPTSKKCVCQGQYYVSLALDNYKARTLMGEVMKQSVNKRSMTKYIKTFAMIFFLLFLISFIFSQLSAQCKLKESAKRDSRMILMADIERIQNDMFRISNNLYLNMSDSENLSIIEHSGDLNHIRMSELALRAEIEKLMTNENLVSLIIYYAPKSYNQSFLSVGNMDPTLRQRLGGRIRLFTEQESAESRWNCIVEEEGQYYWCHLYRVNSSDYFCVVTKLETLLRNLNKTKLQTNSYIGLSDGNGQLYAVSDPVLPKDYSDKEKVRINGTRYIEIKQELDKDLWVNLFISEKEINNTLMESRVTFELWLFVFIILYAFSNRTLYRYITKPIMQISEKMDDISEESLDKPIIIETKFDEYKKLTSTYNHMISQVKHLRMDIYEHQLEEKKLQLQYLQLQMNPHFYLNALNIIYSMAQVQDYETIQELTSSLVEYSRYMFRNATELVPLSDELRFVRNYVRIQQIRFMGEIDFQEQVDKQFEHVLVPPFCIQTFVENSVKYGGKYRERKQISIIATVYQENYLKLEIRDHGKGFPDEVLKIFQMGENLKNNEGKFVGIHNVKQRLHIIFGEGAKVVFRNEDGAVVDIYVPYM